MTPRCCHRVPKSGRGAAADTLLGLLPGALFLLVPKCPACLAAYIAAITGLGLSVSAAAGIRAALLYLAIAAVAVLAIRVACRLVRRPGGSLSSPPEP